MRRATKRITPAQLLLARDVSEKHLQSDVLDMLRIGGWDYRRPADRPNAELARQGLHRFLPEAGYPDLYCYHPSGMTGWLELKTERNSLSKKQKPIVAKLKRTAENNPLFFCYVIRPSNLIAGDLDSLIFNRQKPDQHL